jgi:dihydroorotate dehydrogenase (NAD+) catalytic subunit
MDLAVERFGARFRNPILLAAGTCGFGEEVSEVADLSRVGGLVTKSVTLEPRGGNPAPRVAEFRAGMLNSVGLANPGAHAALREKLPWMRDHLEGLQVFVSVAGNSPDEYLRTVEILERGDGFLGFELNLSCPNDTKQGAFPFALDPDAIHQVVEKVRAATGRVLLVKLAPNAPVLEPAIRAAESTGADGLTLVNTLPGLAFDPETRRPLLGAGPGGMSGPALLPVGVHAVWSASRLTRLPLLGAGGVARGADAVQYLLAGATLVQVGTASFWDPRAAGRVAKELRTFGSTKGLRSVEDLVGAGIVEGGAPSRPASGSTSAEAREKVEHARP